MRLWLQIALLAGLWLASGPAGLRAEETPPLPERNPARAQAAKKVPPGEAPPTRRAGRNPVRRPPPCRGREKTPCAEASAGMTILVGARRRRGQRSQKP
jgi:hypothetical protein